MKKPNINVDAVKQWGIDHGEKVALAVVGVLFLLFVVGYLTTDTYDGRPADLETAARKAQEKLGDRQSWEKGGEAGSFENRPYHEVAKTLTTPIDATEFAWRDQQGPRAMFPPLNVTSGRAREPEFLAPVEPIATASRGAFEILDEKQDDPRQNDRNKGRRNARDKDEEDNDRARRQPRKQLEGYRWVAVRAAVPLGLQLAKYRDANVAGSRSRNAEPRYKGFVLQRRELTSSSTWSEWREVNASAIRRVIPRVRLGGAEVVALNETFDLTSPLPIREGGEWTRQEAGHPRFKSPDPDEVAEEQKPAEDDPGIDAGGGEVGPFGLPISRNQNTQRDAAALARDERLRQQQAKARGGKVNRDDEYVLFRTFDFTAEPGQCYQYRVQLVLENPNAEKTAREVQRVAGAEQQPNEGAERRTPWSTASEAVCVPPDTNYYVKEFIANRGQKGSVEIDLVSWEKESGKFESQSVRVTQGQVISTRGRTDISMPDFVLDYTGGPVRLAQIPDFEEELPAEMLVVNESGEMIVRSERADDDAHAVIQRRTDRDEDRDEDDGGNVGSTDRVTFSVRP